MSRSDSPIFVIANDGRLGSVRSSSSLKAIDESVTRTGWEVASRRDTLGSPVPMRRFRAAAVVVCATFLLLVGRAAHLQVVEGASYRAQADRNRVQTRVIPPPRGSVFDRFGMPLAVNVPTFALTLVPSALPRVSAEDPPERQEETRAERERILARAGALADLAPEDIETFIEEFAASPREAIPVARGLSYETAMRLAVELPHLPGFAVETSTLRSYDTSSATIGHVLGYTGSISAAELAALREQGYRPTDAVGKVGLEKSAEDVLRGVPGRTAVEVNASGGEMRLIDKNDPVPGTDVTLALDLAFQRYAEERLRPALEASQARKASIVAIDPRDGGIRALVSWPAYDPNLFVNGVDAATYRALTEDPDHPLFPRAVAGEFPSGSTFKPFVAYAALREGIITERTSFLSTGGVRVGVWFFPDWRVGGHGMTDVRKAIAESVNSFFYIIGGGLDAVTGLGVDRITAYARQFGFGKETGVDLPYEADGFLPSRTWKEEAKGERWYVGDTYHLSIGQGDFLATPLQMAAATAIVANGGTRVTPRLVERAGGEPVPWTPVDGDPFDAHALNVVRQGMRQTVTDGSARSLNALPRAVAGKTGTAQPGGNVPTHAWFVGFGPYEDPDLAIAILIENGGEGSSVAVPLANDLFAWWFEHRTP